MTWEPEDVVLVATTALVHGLQLSQAAMAVGKSRRKFKIDPPKMDGPDEFIRTLRAQQNGLEFAVIFQIVLWLSGLFVHQVPAALLGLVYVFGRYQYFKGYVKEARLRVPGFKLSANCLRLLLVLSVSGLLNTALKVYLGLDVAAFFSKGLHGAKHLY